jgi:hypothetical protein
VGEKYDAHRRPDICSSRCQAYPDAHANSDTDVDVGQFQGQIASSDFQALGSVVGSIKVALIIGSSSGAITGTFKVKGGDSDVPCL